MELKKIKECFSILINKYKIDIEDAIDFKNLIDDLENEKRKSPIRTNWREIDKAIKKESKAEDCIIPMRERY